MKCIPKNRGFFVIFTVITAVLAIIGAILFFWIPAIFAVIWLYSLWRFSAVKYRANDSELEIQSGIFVRAVRMVDLGGILWKSRITIGNAVITVLHTSAGRVVLFAEF